jgi:hypothetical protein
MEARQGRPHGSVSGMACSTRQMDGQRPTPLPLRDTGGSIGRAASFENLPRCSTHPERATWHSETHAARPRRAPRKCARARSAPEPRPEQDVFDAPCNARTTRRTSILCPRASGPERAAFDRGTLPSITRGAKGSHRLTRGRNRAKWRCGTTSYRRKMQPIGTSREPPCRWGGRHGAAHPPCPRPARGGSLVDAQNRVFGAIVHVRRPGHDDAPNYGRAPEVRSMVRKQARRSVGVTG